MRRQIDLLEAMAYSQQRPAGRPVLSGVAVGSLLLILLTGTFLYRKAAEASGLRTKVEMLRTRMHLLSEAAKVTAPVGGARAALPALSRPIRWSPLLEEISLIVPEGVWTTRWEGGSDPGSGALRMKLVGGAKSQERFSLFLTALERSAVLSEPRLAYARRTKGEIQFEISVGLKGEGLR